MGDACIARELRCLEVSQYFTHHFRAGLLLTACRTRLNGDPLKDGPPRSSHSDIVWKTGLSDALKGLEMGLP